MLAFRVRVLFTPSLLKRLAVNVEQLSIVQNFWKSVPRVGLRTMVYMHPARLIAVFHFDHAL